MIRIAKLRVLCCLLLSVGAGTVMAGDGVSLDSRYSDEMNGFSIRPPKGGVRSNALEASCLAQWECRKKNSSKLLWSLSVHRFILNPPESDIRAAAGVLESQLSKAGAKINAKVFLTLSGKPAVSFSGESASKNNPDADGTKTKRPKICFRQAWIQLSPSRLIAIKWACVSAPKSFLDTMWTKILAEFQLHDTKEMFQRKSENAKRGSDFLRNKLTSELLGNVVASKPQWFLVRKKGLPVGWQVTESRYMAKKQSPGYKIRTWAKSKIPDKGDCMIRKVLFVDSQLASERWQVRVRIGSGKQATSVVEDGLRKQDFILSAIRENNRNEQQRKNVPKSVKIILLPKAIGMLLPKLIDLQTPAAYTFAEYDALKNDFQMRTITVVGLEYVKIDGLSVSAVKLTDQPSAGAELSAMWVDAKGNILLSKSPGGVSAEAVSSRKVLARYPKAKMVLRVINKAEKKRPVKESDKDE